MLFNCKVGLTARTRQLNSIVNASIITYLRRFRTEHVRFPNRDSRRIDDTFSVYDCGKNGKVTTFKGLLRRPIAYNITYRNCFFFETMD